MSATINVARSALFLSKHSNSGRIFHCACRSYELNTSLDNKYDVVIVGGGTVGMATARELIIRHPLLTFAVVDKESKLAVHQSGHKSVVIHAGIYYKPGTVKAQLCVQGLDLMYKYCDDIKVPYKKCGKLIVATDPVEVPRLEALFERRKENGVQDLRMIGPEEIKSIGPNCINQLLQCRFMVTCCGLQSDHIAQLSGCNIEPRIVPFRGDYLLLKPEKSNMINGNIYLVPIQHYLSWVFISPPE